MVQKAGHETLISKLSHILFVSFYPFLSRSLSPTLSVLAIQRAGGLFGNHVDPFSEHGNQNAQVTSQRPLQFSDGEPVPNNINNNNARQRYGGFACAGVCARLYIVCQLFLNAQAGG